MGKKLRYNDLQPIKQDTPSTEPILGEGDALLQAKSESFKQDSAYDEGLTFGMDQDRNRAFNQPWYDQVGNSIVKTVPGIALGIVENVGYLAELGSGDQDYDNLLTSVARNSRDWIENKLPTYRENPEEVFDLKDSGWWISHGQGLVESIGEFLVTGAGVGSTLKGGAKALTKVLPLKAAASGEKLLNATAQLGTASALAYTEGAMSGAQVYKEVLALTGDQQKAAEAAATTVRLNTVLNTGLNLTALSPLFRGTSNLDNSVKSALNRLPKETTQQYISRLTALESQGIPRASMLKRLGLEAVQEGIEEDVNLFAEGEGKIVGGIKKSKGTGLDRFIESSLSEEGLLNFSLGAIGGIGQTAGMEYLPLRKDLADDGSVTRISARNLELKSQDRYKKQVINDLKKDVELLNARQLKLNQAVIAKDVVGIEEAKRELFNITALRALRTETVNELANELNLIAQTDNTNLGEDGLTDAMRQGLADNIDDNNYKDTAVKKAADLIKLNKEYRDLLAYTGKPYVASEIFRDRLNIYTHEDIFEELTKNEALELSKVLATVPDKTFTKDEVTSSLKDIAILAAEQKAYDSAQSYLTVNNRKDEADLIASERRITDKLLSDFKKTSGITEEELNQTLGILSPLIEVKASKLVVGKNLNEAKNKYATSLNNINEVEKRLEKEIKDLTKARDEAIKKQKEKEQEDKRKKDFEEAKNKKDQTTAPVVTDPVISDTDSINTDDTGIDDTGIDNNLEPVFDADFDEPIIDNTDSSASNTDTLVTEAQGSAGVDQLDNIPPITVAYIPLTTKQKDIIDTSINETLEEQELTNSNNYAAYQKIAYLAQEQDKQTGKTLNPFVISERYKVLHDDTINSGVSVSLKVDTTNQFYEKNKDNPNTVPIGVYYKGNLIGYLPTYKDFMSPTFSLVRKYIVENGEVIDTIASKTPGVLNRGTKGLLIDNYPVLPQLAIGRNGEYEVGVNVAFSETKLNREAALEGHIYTIDNTPIGIPILNRLDVNKVSDEVVTSMLNVLKFYFKGARENSPSILTQEEQQIIDIIQDKYGYDLSTPAGLRKYFDLFFHATNLDERTPEGKANVERIYTSTKADNYYIDVSAKGIRFMRSGAASVEDFGRTDINDNNKTSRLIEHLKNSHYRVDLNKINKNNPFEAPLFKDTINYTEYKKESYNTHIANVTSTNIIGVRLNDNKQTVMVQPTLHLNFDFYKKLEEKIDTVITEKGEKIVSLATSTPVPTITTLEDNLLEFDDDVETVKKC